MAIELELKLMIQPEHLQAVSDLLDQICSKSNECTIGPTQELMNAYFDTPEERLKHAGVALRIRAVDGRYIQTLKTRGTNRVGMHARGEWEWELQQDLIDLSVLEPAMLPADLKNIDWGMDLVEAFRTDFTRKIWLVTAEKSSMEVVVDKGKVHSPYGSEPICELELELKGGDEEGLYRFAETLAQHIPVQVSTVSKAAKGNRLKNNRIELPKEPSSNATQQLTAYWYDVWLAYWEAMCFMDDPVLLVPVCDAMEHLSTYLPNELSKVLLSVKNHLIQLQGASVDESPALLANQLDIGQVMLSIGRWMNHQQT
ncbi:CYTH domain-containing protein [Marinomonas agarivorans]|nr:CYTH domain-containing protein [Marinomonas agarivorans]